MNNDTLNSLQIDDLKKLEVINGQELILIQSPNSEETNCIRIDLLLANLVNLLKNGTTVSIAETDPTVPSYIKAITENDVNKWRKNVEDISTIKDQITSILSSTVSITSFSCTPSVVEIGSVINTVTLNWATNFKTITRQLINDNDIGDVSKRSKTFDGPFTNTQVFNLTVEGDDGSVANKVTSLEFLNGIYYGSSKLSQIDSNFIKSLIRRLTDTRTFGFTTVSREQEYIYIALPKRFGNPKFEIVSEIADFEFIKEFEFENSSGYVENYCVYRTTNVHLGQTTVKMS